MKLTTKEKAILLIGLQMYKKKISKMMKDSGDLQVGEKEIKITFLETDRLIERVQEL